MAIPATALLYRRFSSASTWLIILAVLAYVQAGNLASDSLYERSLGLRRSRSVNARRAAPSSLPVYATVALPDAAIYIGCPDVLNGTPLTRRALQLYSIDGADKDVLGCIYGPPELPNSPSCFYDYYTGLLSAGFIGQDPSCPPITIGAVLPSESGDLCYTSCISRSPDYAVASTLVLDTLERAIGCNFEGAPGTQIQSIFCAFDLQDGSRLPSSAPEECLRAIQIRRGNCFGIQGQNF